MLKKEQIEAIQQEWRDRLQKSFWNFVYLMTMMEAAIVIARFALGRVPDGANLSVIFKTIILPTAICALIALAVGAENQSVKPSKIKNCAFVYGAMSFAAVVVCFHGYLILTVCTFALPIVISATFTDLKLTAKSLLVGIPVMYASIYISYLLDPNFELANHMAQGTINLGFLVAIFMVCRNIITLSQRKDELLDDYDKSEENLNHALTLDAMTSLYNHTEFNKVLERRRAECIRNRKYMSIVVADIDHFKRVNDTYGHEQGDKVLITVANHLLHFCSDKGQVFRYGGEEFAVIFMNQSADQALAIMEEMRDCLSKVQYDFMPEGEHITISIGIYKYGGETEIGSHEIFNNADQAMYEAKNSGRNCCRVYTVKSRIY